MKSGPHLKGWTASPRLRNAAISASVTVVFPTPLAGPATTNPCMVSTINAPHDCALIKIVDYVEGTGILCQSKQISLWQAQDFRQGDSNHAGVGDHESATAPIRCHDGLHLPIYPLLELAERLGTGDRLGTRNRLGK